MVFVAMRELIPRALVFDPKGYVSDWERGEEVGGQG